MRSYHIASMHPASPPLPSPHRRHDRRIGRWRRCDDGGAHRRDTSLRQTPQHAQDGVLRDARVREIDAVRAVELRIDEAGTEDVPAAVDHDVARKLGGVGSLPKPRRRVNDDAVLHPDVVPHELAVPEDAAVRQLHDAAVAARPHGQLVEGALRGFAIHGAALLLPVLLEHRSSDGLQDLKLRRVRLTRGTLDQIGWHVLANPVSSHRSVTGQATGNARVSAQRNTRSARALGPHARLARASQMAVVTLAGRNFLTDSAPATPREPFRAAVTPSACQGCALSAGARPRFRTRAGRALDAQEKKLGSRAAHGGPHSGRVALPAARRCWAGPSHRRRHRPRGGRPRLARAGRSARVAAVRRRRSGSAPAAGDAALQAQRAAPVAWRQQLLRPDRQRGRLPACCGEALPHASHSQRLPPRRPSTALQPVALSPYCALPTPPPLLPDTCR